MFELLILIKEINLKPQLLVTTFVALIFALGCTSKAQVEKILEENPDIVFNAIKKKPGLFFKTINDIRPAAEAEMKDEEEKGEEARIEEEFKSPKSPVVEEGRVIFGKKDAPITIVEYSDFQCPACAAAYNTVKQVEKEYGDKVRVVYKHLPLSFHPMAMPAAKYFEAIALQDHAKAEKFFHEIFMNQRSLTSDGEKFLDNAAKKSGVNMAQLKKDIANPDVQKRIDKDSEEANKFDFQGTPGFLINGVSLKGAYPFPFFKKVIDRHLAKK